MKFLLLDIDDTVAPLNYHGRDAVHVNDSYGKDLGIPCYIGEYLAKFFQEDGHQIVWCTNRDVFLAHSIERKFKFKSNGFLRFPKNSCFYAWNKLPEIIKFCNAHSNDNDIVIVADNCVKEGTRGVKLPKNLKLICPSDQRGCLSLDDLKLIEWE